MGPEDHRPARAGDRNGGKEHGAVVRCECGEGTDCGPQDSFKRAGRNPQKANYAKTLLAPVRRRAVLKFRDFH